MLWIGTRINWFKYQKINHAVYHSHHAWYSISFYRIIDLVSQNLKKKSLLVTRTSQEKLVTNNKISLQKVYILSWIWIYPILRGHKIITFLTKLNLGSKLDPASNHKWEFYMNFVFDALSMNLHHEFFTRFQNSVNTNRWKTKPNNHKNRTDSIHKTT